MQQVARQTRGRTTRSTSRDNHGGFKRKEPLTTIVLASGDAFVMGGRLRYHGVPGIVAGTAPTELSLRGRHSLTFRQF